MKVESSLELLLPTVTFGNIKACIKVGYDTVTDLGRIEESQKKLNVVGDKTSSEVICETARKQVIHEIVALKRDIDKLTRETFELELK